MLFCSVASGAARGQVWGVAAITGILDTPSTQLIGSRPDVAALIADCVGRRAYGDHASAIQRVLTPHSAFCHGVLSPSVMDASV